MNAGEGDHLSGSGIHDDVSTFKDDNLNGYSSYTAAAASRADEKVMDRRRVRGPIGGALNRWKEHTAGARVLRRVMAR